MKITVIPGSIGEDSYNKKLSLAAKKIAPKDIQINVHPLDDIPMFSKDLEKQGIPESVSDLKEDIKDADILLISTPEYNNMIPGVLKNALEWLSRRDKNGNTVIQNKKVAIMGASTGKYGTVRSQNQLILLCNILKMNTKGSLMLPVSHVHTLFDDLGNLTDQDTRNRLEKFLNSIQDWHKN